MHKNLNSCLHILDMHVERGGDISFYIENKFWFIMDIPTMNEKVRCMYALHFLLNMHKM